VLTVMAAEEMIDRIVLLDSDPRRRGTLARALRGAGVQVSTLGSIAEMERWPVGEVLLMDVRFFSPWWHTVGARHVMVLATPEAGPDACARGASAWIPHGCTPDALLGIVKKTCARPDSAAPCNPHGTGPLRHR
jgi:hypothetical protein